MSDTNETFEDYSLRKSKRIKEVVDVIKEIKANISKFENNSNTAVLPAMYMNGNHIDHLSSQFRLIAKNMMHSDLYSSLGKYESELRSLMS